MHIEYEQLKNERLSPKKGKATNKEKAQIVSELRRKYKLAELLKIAEIPRSAYYYYLKDTAKPDKCAPRSPVLKQIFKQNKGRYGYRRLRDALQDKGIRLITRPSCDRMKRTFTVSESNT